MEEKKNANERSDAISAHRMQVALLVLAAIMLGFSMVVALPLMTNWIKSTFVREPDYIINVLNTPYRLPDKKYETAVSDLYIIKMDVNAATQVLGLSGVRFSIKYKNMGKTPIENPYLRIYLIDSLNRVLAEWHGEINKDKFKEGISFAVDSLSAKGKEIYGKIHIYALAYDRRGDKAHLAAYLLFSMDIGSMPLFVRISGFISVGLMVIAVLISLFAFLISYSSSEIPKHNKGKVST